MEISVGTFPYRHEIASGESRLRIVLASLVFRWLRMHRLPRMPIHGGSPHAPPLSSQSPSPPYFVSYVLIVSVPLWYVIRNLLQFISWPFVSLHTCLGCWELSRLHESWQKLYDGNIFATISEHRAGNYKISRNWSDHYSPLNVTTLFYIISSVRWASGSVQSSPFYPPTHVALHSPLTSPTSLTSVTSFTSALLPFGHFCHNYLHIPLGLSLEIRIKSNQFLGQQVYNHIITPPTT